MSHIGPWYVYVKPTPKFPMGFRLCDVAPELNLAPEIMETRLLCFLKSTRVEAMAVAARLREMGFKTFVENFFIQT